VQDYALAITYLCEFGFSLNVAIKQNTGKFAVFEKPCFEISLLWDIKLYQRVLSEFVYRKSISSVCIILGRHSENRIEDGSSSSYEQPHIFDNGFFRLDLLYAVLHSIFRTSQPIQQVHNVWKLRARLLESIERQLNSTTKQALGTRQWDKGILDAGGKDEET
jgi:hypothetical protein